MCACGWSGSTLEAAPLAVFLRELDVEQLAEAPDAEDTDLLSNAKDDLELAKRGRCPRCGSIACVYERR